MRYKLRNRQRSFRVGWHKRGEEGTGLTQRDGTISFFPDRGGFLSLPPTELQRVTPPRKRRKAPVPPCLLPKVIKRARRVKRVIAH